MDWLQADESLFAELADLLLDEEVGVDVEGESVSKRQAVATAAAVGCEGSAWWNPVDFPVCGEESGMDVDGVRDEWGDVSVEDLQCVGAYLERGWSTGVY